MKNARIVFIFLMLISTFFQSFANDIKALEAYGTFRKPPLTFAMVGVKNLEEEFRNINASTAFYHMNPIFKRVSYLQTFINSNDLVQQEWKSDGSGYVKENFNQQSFKQKH